MTVNVKFPYSHLFSFYMFQLWIGLQKMREQRAPRESEFTVNGVFDVPDLV